jgi:hypothetical protein
MGMKLLLVIGCVCTLSRTVHGLGFVLAGPRERQSTSIRPARARQQLAAGSSGWNDFEQRVESVKAAVVGGLTGSIASVVPGLISDVLVGRSVPQVSPRRQGHGDVIQGRNFIVLWGCLVKVGV